MHSALMRPRVRAIISHNSLARNYLRISFCNTHSHLLGTFPLDVDITAMLPGVYVLKVVATDIYESHGYYHLQYTSKSIGMLASHLCS